MRAEEASRHVVGRARVARTKRRAELVVARDSRRSQRATLHSAGAALARASRCLSSSAAAAAN